MFKVYLTTFGYFLQDDYSSEEDAYKAGRRHGFQFQVVKVK